MYNMSAVTNRCVNNATMQFDKLGYIATLLLPQVQIII